MSIIYNKDSQTFSIHTKETTYQMQISPYGHLLHLYYGQRIQGQALELLDYRDRGFSGNPYEADRDRTYSLDYLPQEYPTFGTGDYRQNCLSVRYSDGSRDTCLKYEGHHIYPGKYRLTGLPALYSDDNENQKNDECQPIETLEIVMQDKQRQLEVILLYGVFPKDDVITRSVRIVNQSAMTIKLERALSMCQDYLYGTYDMITFHGRHCMERQYQRQTIRHGHQGIRSLRGASSHQYNPFVMIATPEATEDFGHCYGFSFAYSGNFFVDAELGQYQSTRLVMGIEPEGFSYPVASQMSFDCPEVIMIFSAKGFHHLSHHFHDSLRHHMCRGPYKTTQRPILINNWEGTYFDFDGKKLLGIAQKASEAGIELFVLDDGWFGQRDDDFSSLGDWTVNEEKLGMSLMQLIEQVNQLNMKFGLWFEPEMVNEASELYLKHPEWALTIPSRQPIRSRHQLVLNLANADVVDYLFDALYRILSTHPIDYIKWDFNRSLSDVFDSQLDSESQGTIYHNYCLGLYRLLERIIEAFPKLLIESCSGGGGRFDAGMLHYSPQIWTSDNTDAIDRLFIQEGTSYGYPISAVGSHISVVPNHQTGRIVPLETRKVLAMSGSFGYELDLEHMDELEFAQLSRQISEYKRYWPLIHQGRYYRLVHAHEEKELVAWMYVDKVQCEALVNIVFLLNHGNPTPRYIKLKGLSPHRNYWVSHLEQVISGDVLMYGGIKLPILEGDFQSLQIEIKNI